MCERERERERERESNMITMITCKSENRIVNTNNSRTTQKELMSRKAIKFTHLYTNIHK